MRLHVHKKANDPNGGVHGLPRLLKGVGRYFGPKSNKGILETKRNRRTGTKHCLGVEGGGVQWTKCVGLVGSEYRCVLYGVTKVSVPESVPVSSMDFGWRSGSARYQRRLQMNAIANRYLTSVQ